jgi:phosphatidylglycerophosphatase C
MQQKTLVLFDFDGTLTKGDSLLYFLLFAIRPGKLLLGGFWLVLKLMTLFLSGKWNNGKAKEALLAVFFKGKSQAALEALGSDFYNRKMPELLRPEMLQKLREYRHAGATVALVSASPEIWLRPFCTAENIQMICTVLNFENGNFTGKLASPNCNGAEKARRIKAAFDLSGFDKIIAFGNSSGDAAMFALADEAWLVRKNALVKVNAS